MIRRSIAMSLGLATTLLAAVNCSAQVFLKQTNLVSDNQAVNPAILTDPNLVNAWGITSGSTSPFWVSDNGTGLSTLYSVNAITNAPAIVPLVVTIPLNGPVSGTVFNPSSGTGAFNADNFLFVGENGTVSGWRGALGTHAETLQAGSVDNVYKGVATASTGGHAYLYSANFRTGSIDILKGDAGAPSLAGTFTDPTLPAGYAPFGIQNLGGKIYVTYALQDGAKHDNVAGAGNGFVSVYDLTGNFLGRVGSGGTLNSPWGLAIAPSSFGSLAGDLLVGNFGDGRINTFDSGNMFIGQLLNSDGNPLTIDGLWGLMPGNGGNGGNSKFLFFTAGPNHEANGLFGSLQAVPEPGSVALFVSAIVPAAALLRRRRRR